MKKKNYLFMLGAMMMLSTVSLAQSIQDHATPDTWVTTNNGGTDEDRIRFVTSGSERMIIDNNGRVGIGTSTPASSTRVDVEGFNLASNGTNSSIYSLTSASLTNVNAFAYAKNSYASGWANYGFAHAYWGRLDSLKELRAASTYTSWATGGYFELLPDEPLNSSYLTGRTYWIAGVHGVLNAGNMSIYPSDGAVSAVIGRDLLDHLDTTNVSKSSYAGFFIGKGYFSGHVGIGCSPVSAYTLKISGSGYASGGVWTSSDERFKNEITTITGALDLVKKLRGTTYEFKLDEFPEMNFNPGKNYGFIAQELIKVIPEAVKKDQGYYAVNYDAIIPVLTEAIKEQEGVIETQNEKISELEKKIETLYALFLTSTGDNSTGTGKLLQNSPNPFTEETLINYDIESSTNAAVIIYDIQGKELNRYDITESGSGSITIKGSEYTPGMYFYKLIADGQVLDTKTMIMTK
jgi:hypothetical protein